MRVFFSYGHDDNRWLVEKIKEDLEKVENGSHEVWIDSEKIKFTDDWRRTISDGIHHSHMVLSFLSKHSIRDPGVCLNELAIAVGVMGGVVHSVLLENPNKVKPPVTISHLQYLDMHEWKVIKKKGEAAFEEWYLVKLNEIVKVLMDPANVRFAGEIEDLDKKLVPLSTSVDISRLLKGGFVGREWIVKEIEKWRVAANKQQVFCITGGPGIGKSAIAAYLAHHVKCHVIGVVFCRDSEAESIDPNRIVRTLAFQIATREPEFRKYLLSSVNKLITEKPLNEYSASDLFKEFILKSSGNCIDGNKDRYLVIIDGLDEIEGKRGEEFARFLAFQKDAFPRWLKLIVTSRPSEPHIMPHLQAFSPYVLNADDARNKDDIRNYIRNWLVYERKINKSQLIQCVEPLTSASEGNFLYITLFRDMIDQSGSCGNDLLMNSRAYPQGLSSFYREGFLRKFDDFDDYLRYQAPLLRLMVVVRSPLPLDIICDVLGIDEEALAKKVMLPFGSFLVRRKDCSGDTVDFFHRSVKEWLIDEEKAGSYFVSKQMGKRRLGEFLLDQLRTMHGLEQLNAYYVSELPLLMMELDDKDLIQISHDFSNASFFDIVKSISTSLIQVSNLKQSEAWSKLGLTLNILHYGPESLKTAESYFDLGVLYDLRAEYDSALSEFEKCLNIRNKHLGQGHTLTIAAVNAIAHIYLKLQYFDMALTYIELILEFTSKPQDESITLANSYCILALFRRDIDDYDSSTDYFKKSIIILRKYCSGGMFDLANVLVDFAQTLRFQGKYELALESTKEAKSLLRAHFSVSFSSGDTYSLAKIDLMIVDLYRCMHKYVDALTMALRVLKDLEANQIFDSNTVLYLRVISLIYFQLDDYLTSLEFMERALNGSRLVNGSDHICTALCEAHMATFSMCLGEYKKADKYFTSALINLDNNIPSDYLIAHECCEMLISYCDITPIKAGLDNDPDIYFVSRDLFYEIVLGHPCTVPKKLLESGPRYQRTVNRRRLFKTLDRLSNRIYNIGHKLSYSGFFHLAHRIIESELGIDDAGYIGYEMNNKMKTIHFFDGASKVGNIIINQKDHMAEFKEHMEKLQESFSRMEVKVNLR